MSWTIETIFARERSPFQLHYYVHRYGEANVFDLEKVESGNGYKYATATQNIGRVQRDIDCGNALICEDKLVFLNRPIEGLNQ